MNFQNHAQYPAQSVTGFKVRQHLNRRKPLEFPGGSTLWTASAKAACLVLLVVLGISLWMGHVAAQLHESVQAIEASQYTIRDQQISLLAARAKLLSEQHVYEQAGAELALFEPNDYQITKM